jgi:hypothetical protein
LVLTVPLSLTPSTDIGPDVTDRQLTVGFSDGSFEPVASPARDEAAGARHDAALGASSGESEPGPAARRRRLVTEVHK